MDPDNIVGAFGGVKEKNPQNGLVERTRNMRGEDIAYAYLLGGEQDMPEEEWGYRYWDALEYLKNRGVRHIVIGFSQVVSDSVLTMVEVYNQIGKEIGVKTWLKYKEGDYSTYPGVGHPFADYWGNWVDTECRDAIGDKCSFTMGEHNYPPPRQTPLDTKREDMDPSLAYDLSEFGHLGYDPARGAPVPGKPVQDQYTGTWEVYIPPNWDPRLGQLLAKHVLNAAFSPRVYITNGDLKSISAGDNITWTALVIGGVPEYRFEWFIKNEGSDWRPEGDGGSSWTWTPAEEDSGSIAVRCKVTDANKQTGEVLWEKFKVEEFKE
jgi:hypothetical protein